MKRIKKIAIASAVLLLVLLFTVSCANNSVYGQHDDKGYTVSVKYDANGGIFQTNTSVIIDTYKFSELPVNAEGMKEVALLKPEDATVRGKENSYNAINSGYFFGGWYTTVEPVTDENGNHLDIYGNIITEVAPAAEDTGAEANAEGGSTKSAQIPAYRYSGKWDFEKGRVEIDPNKTYTSAEPVITLYAAWIPQHSFSFEFYDKENPDQLLGTYDIDYLNTKYDAYTDVFTNATIKLPTWDVNTGRVKMGDVPAVIGKTCYAVYASPDATEPLDASTITHIGGYNEDLTPANQTMKLYLECREGDWYKIYNAKQLLDNWSVSGHYELMADLDFAELYWKDSAMYGNFSGSIVGNGHTIKNVSMEHTNPNKTNVGLFGSISATAEIRDVNFENIALTVKTGSKKGSDVMCALFAGVVESGAKLENVKLTGGKLVLEDNTDLKLLLKGMYFALVCTEGVDNLNFTDYEVTFEVTGDGLTATLGTDGNEIIVEKSAG